MISKEEVKHIAKLARLKLSEEEAVKIQKELSSILDYFNLLKEVGLKPISKKKDLFENVVREDLVKKQSPETINKLFETVPKKEKRYVRVKAVF